MSATIAIAGAGLAGRLFAWALARAGHRVQVFDARPGPEPMFDGLGAAAFTAAGMLSPLAELEKADVAIAAAGWRSLALWPGLVQQLRRCRPVGLQLNGSLLLAQRSDGGAARRVLDRLQQPGLGAFPTPQALDPEALAALEPALRRSAGLQAWLLPGEGLVHPLEAMAALQADAAGVAWHWSMPAVQCEAHRLTLADGRGLDADWVIDCRGLGARSQLPALRGVRGEVIALEAPGHGLTRPVRLLHPRHRVYLVPRTADQLLIGASEIESEDRSPVSLQSAVELMAAAHSVMPQLGEARITRLDRNLRPALPDHQPHLHHEAGLLRLNGLYRHGWLLAPALVDQLLRRSGLGALPDPA
ncbi:FAD-dependent oxidoreductase [Pelomonas sp. APW6]|uniref:FAD-dependent oxidoreductase n=1 Tax=Roseateles subflavus TaxID=3053353 RepID=A0ABT7LF68_9BURK|nr:FAD-dependent oxidoreductase [Pelomonas sp. APW6]MDL5031488.1 FAD-dependent oxidoreductase [Pelomonas sp. APW6]